MNSYLIFLSEVGKTRQHSPHNDIKVVEYTYTYLGTRKLTEMIIRQDGVGHAFMTYVASHLTSLATRDAGQSRVTPYVRLSVYSEICLQCNMETTNDHTVVVRILNLFHYF